MRARGQREPATLLLFAAWTTLVLLFWFGIVVASMRAGAPRPADLYGYFFPKYVYESRELMRGHLPLWNRYEFAGVPLLGVGQPAVLYPPRVLLFATLPPSIALHCFMIAHYILLGVGTFLALRALGLVWPGAALGTLVVTFQPAMMNAYAPHWISNFAWVPFVVAAFVRTIEKPGLAPALALALAASLLVFAGYPEYPIDTALVLVIFWFAATLHAVRAGETRRLARGTALVLGSAILASALTAVHWVPLLEAYAGSQRSASNWASGINPVALSPVLFGGPREWFSVPGLIYVPPLGALGMAACLGLHSRQHRWVMVLLAALCVVGFLAVGSLPLLSKFRSILCWVTILHVPLAFLAGAGFDRLVGMPEGNHASPDRRAFLVGGFAAVLLLPLLDPRSLAWFGLGIAAIAANRGRTKRGATASALAALASAVGCIFGLLTVGAFQSPPRGFIGQAPYPNVTEAEERGAMIRAACGQDADGRVLAPEETQEGISVLAQIATVQGYPESLAPARMTRLLDEAGLLNVRQLDWNRLEQRNPVLRLLDLRCVVAEAERARLLAPLGFLPHGALKDGRLAYVRPGASAFLVAQAKVVMDDHAALAAVLAPDFAPDRWVVLEGSADALEGTSNAADADTGSVQQLAPLRSGLLRFRLSAPSPRYLIVSENWYPGWHARVDGHPAPVHRADFALLAVRVPPGTHDVELQYTPRAFGIAVTASGIAMILTALAAFALRQRIKQVGLACVHPGPRPHRAAHRLH
jgi:hypothetical protein